VTPVAFLRVAQVTLGLTVLNIVSGGAVRLTDSGLGCPDWPGCYKQRFTPPLALHPAMEFGNRLVVVCLCTSAAVALACALLRSPRRRDLVALSALLVGGIVGEALLGEIVVYSKLNPYAVMTHFMLGVALLTVALALALHAGRAPGRGVAKVAPRELVSAHLTWGLLLLAVVAGTATTAAGPHAGGPGAKRLPVPLADMARVHSGIVLVLVAAVLGLLHLLERGGAPQSVRMRGRAMLAAMAAQGIIGYSQYWSHLPALLVGIHVFGVTVVWSAMYWFADGLRLHAPETLPLGAGSARSVGSGPGVEPAEAVVPG
jgi:cytochrome c oxidase assembly protein subunit 15